MAARTIDAENSAWGAKEPEGELDQPTRPQPMPAKTIDDENSAWAGKPNRTEDQQSINRPAGKAYKEVVYAEGVLENNAEHGLQTPNDVAAQEETIEKNLEIVEKHNTSSKLNPIAMYELHEANEELAKVGERSAYIKVDEDRGSGAPERH